MALPYEDVYSAIGASRASVAVRVYLKTHMAEDTAAERQVRVGKFKLVYPSESCYVGAESGRSSAFTTWDDISGLSAGEYGRGFRNGQAMGYNVQMLTIELLCTPGTHAVGIVTMETSDGNGLTSAPNEQFATSVGRADGYVAAASVLVRSTTVDVAVFAYPDDGRASLNNLAMLGVPLSPTVIVRLDRISDNPSLTRSRNVHCTGSCTHVPRYAETSSNTCLLRAHSRDACACAR